MIKKGKKAGYISLIIFTVFVCIVTIASSIFAKADAPSATAIVPSRLFVGDSNIESITSNVEYPSDYSIPGMGVRVIASKSGAKISYKNVIDVSTLDKNTDLIRFQVISNQNNFKNLSKIIITLTDAYNKDNCLTFQIGQGWRYEGSISVNYDAQWVYNNNIGQEPLAAAGAYVVSDSIGLGSFIDMCLNYNQFMNNHHRQAIINSYGKEGGLMPECAIALDYATGEIYTLSLREQMLYQGYKDYFAFAKLCDPTIVGTGNEWKKFTTGEVYMDIELLSEGRCGMIISEIAGQKLCGDTVIDEEAPHLYLDLEPQYVEKLPDAAKNKLYKLPQARAIDTVDGNINVEISVSKGKVDVTDEVLKGEYLQFPQTGVYKIRYEAKDAAGNVTLQTLTVECVQMVNPMRLSFADGIDSAEAGKIFTIPEIEVKGGTGKIELSVDYYYNDKKIEIDGSRKIFLNEVGTLRADCYVSDAVGTCVFGSSSLYINVIGKNAPMLDVSGVPYSVISGNKLILPKAEAYNYAYEKSESDYTVDYTVSVNGLNVTDTHTYDVKEKKGELLTVVYTAESNGEKAERRFEVEVIDGSSIFDYFLTTDGVTTNKDKATAKEYSEFLCAGDFDVSFANPLSASKMPFSLALSNGNVKYFDIVFEEFYGDREMFLRFTEKNGEYSYMQVNGKGERYTVAGSFTDSTKGFNFKLDDINGYLCDALDKKLVKIATWTDDSDFNGVTRGGIKFSIRVVSKNTTQPSGIRLYQLSNQYLMNLGAFSDKNLPAVYYYSEMRDGICLPGDSILVSAVEVYDVFSPNASVSVSMRAPDGTMLLSNASCMQSYEIRLAQYGFYSVIYNITDGKNSGEMRVFYEVKDTIPPTAEIVGEVQTEVKLGDVIAIPMVSVNDNYSETTTTVFMVDCYGCYHDVTQKRNYTPTQKGSYRLVVYAVDAAFNATVLQYTIWVK